MDVVQRVGGLGYLIAERFGSQICAGPQGRIAAARVADDLVAGRRGVDRIENGSEGQVAGLDVRRNGERVGFGAITGKNPRDEHH